MKRSIALLLVIGIAGFAALSPAWGQEKKIAFSLNAGVQTDIFNGTSFDKALFTADARVGFLLGRCFEISPEIMVVFSYLSMFEGSGGTLLYPGILLNYRIHNFFVGAGAVLPWWFAGGESGTENLSPKFNIGYTFPNGVQLTAYYLCWTGEDIDLFDAGFAGVTLGYRF